MADGASSSSGKKKKKKNIFGPLVRCFSGHHKEPVDEEGRVQEEQAAPNLEAEEEAAPNLEAEEEEHPNLEAGEDQVPDLHDEEEEGPNPGAEEEQASDLEDEEAASNPSDGEGACSADAEAGSSSSATTGSPASGASLSSIDSFVLRRPFRLNPSPSAPAAASVPGPSNAAAAVADPGTSSASAAGDGAPAEVSSSALQQPAGKKVLLIDSHEPRMTRLANALLELNPLLRVRGLDEYDPRITKTTYNFYDLAIVRHVLPDIDGRVMTWVLKRQVQFTCPIIVLSLMHKGETELFLSGGAQEFIDGPLGKGGLRALLERHHLLAPAAPPPAVTAAGAVAAQAGPFSVSRSRRGRSKSGAAAVTLPRAAAAVADPGPFRQPEGKRVLLIDCHQERRTRLVDALMELNPRLRVHAFDEYDPRITKAKPNYYDLAIVRHVPPEIDGCVMAWVLKHNVQMSCPVVVLSLMHKGDKDHFYENGAQEVIDGPIGTEGLRALLVKHRLLVPEPLPEPPAAG